MLLCIKVRSACDAYFYAESECIPKYYKITPLILQHRYLPVSSPGSYPYIVVPSKRTNFVQTLLVGSNLTKTARLYVFRQSGVSDGSVVSTRNCVEKYRNCEQAYGKKAVHYGMIM